MKEQILEELDKVVKASRTLVNISDGTVIKVLDELANRIELNSQEILKENQRDLDRMDKNDPKYDRLLLSQSRLQDIANDMRNVSSLMSPLGKIIEERNCSNSLNLKKITVPIGVIGIIYEARPNVTFDIFSLCLKSGNACVLKGGSDAEYSNIYNVELIKEVLRSFSIDENIIYLAPADREAVSVILEADKFIDLIVPRGSQNLINYVRANSKVPTLETGAGICHTYFEKSGDELMCQKIIFNAKTRRPSVCNAMDTLLIDRVVKDKLPVIVKTLQDKEVIIYADSEGYEELKGYYPDTLLKEATLEDFGREFLSLQMSLKVVSDYKEAVDRINTYGSKHSEAIVTTDPEAKEYFQRNVDAACVYVNTSTAFTDGAQFGMGAELGISTQKLHARGPVGLKELTSYKWLVESDGRIRV